MRDMKNILKATQDQVNIYDDVVPAKLYQELMDVSRTLNWTFGWTTTSNTAMRYWHHEVGFGEKENTEDISSKISHHPLAVFDLYRIWLTTHVVAADSKILRFYLNGHTFGTDGWPHVDSDRPGELTTVLYLTSHWLPAWGGETVVFDPAGDIAVASQPRPNRLLTFPSHLLHAPRPLHKAFNDLRVVLVVKLATAAVFDDAALVQPGERDLIDFYERTGWAKRNHDGRPLLTHLMGTRRILHRRGADVEVCNAGFFQHIYRDSSRCTLPLDRITLRGKIGIRAERLAWLCHALDRPKCWEIPGLALPLASGEMIDLNAQELADLHQIELAVLDEQGMLAPELRRRLAGSFN